MSVDERRRDEKVSSQQRNIANVMVIKYAIEKLAARHTANKNNAIVSTIYTDCDRLPLLLL